MKSNQALSIFVILIIINSILCSHGKSKFKTKNDKPLRGYFYIQRFYPGSDAIDSIKESEFHTKLMFFEVNKDVIYFAKSLHRIKDIEGKYTNLNYLFHKINSLLKFRFNHFKGFIRSKT